MAQATERRTNQESIEKIKEALIPHIHETRCHPILIRLAWHDSGSYDKVRKVALCRLLLKCAVIWVAQGNHVI